MANSRQLAQSFIGAAQESPQHKAALYRKAASTFMGLAHNPKNARNAEQLAKIGIEFADAAIRERPPTMDDFTDLLHETAQAYEEVGDDPMDLIARRREISAERTPQIPGQIMITPESFNKDATLGRSAWIKFAPTTEEVAVESITQSQNVAFWQGTKKEAQAMTVDISLGFLPPLPIDFADSFGVASVRPFAEVEYGSDGNRTKIQFDVAFGKRLTVVGNYIAVTVGMDPPQANFISTKIMAGASIGAFAAPSQAPLVKTAYIDALLPATESKPIAIPLKAALLLPMQSGLLGGEAAQIKFFNYGGHFVTRVLYLQANTSSMPAIPITGDVAFVSVTNNSGTARDFRLPFQLAM